MAAKKVPAKLLSSIKQELLLKKAALTRNMWINQQELAGRMQVAPELMAALPPTSDAMGMPMMLFDELAHQAAEIAYVNDFVLLMWITLAAMPLVLFLSKPAPHPTPAKAA